MSDVDVNSITRASQLWKLMTEAQRKGAAEAFWSEGEAGAEHAEVVGLLSRRLNFRVKSVLALPLEKKVKYTAGLAAVSDGVAGRLLVTFHLARQRPMMSAFLDALGIAHDNGLISDEASPAVDATKLPDAVKAIREQFPTEDVDLYLHTLRLQDHATWAGVGEFL
ncbi:hypothetical protein TBR22_A35300 [Luteitalea sp. TBR-22]|uniref:hypothetical protein n=1 Tax=Luteitalea sp. TBR-22 TaxID=2802971 RepID=UPI001AF95D40|nr:hypothetical protein [Luteitalea sp. TBR-22]BCS34300.1 hypothetical protein TBR22_A35300 [Luteitalea sp. TBR-22]